MDPDPNDIPSTPPEGEEDKAIWSIRRVAKALGQNITEAQAREYFETARSRLVDAMAAGNVNQPGQPGDSGV